MSHLGPERPFTCGTCDLEISGTPVFHVGLAFCCPGCAAGGPCVCSYDEEVIDDERSGSQARLTGAELADDRRGLASTRR